MSFVDSVYLWALAVLPVFALFVWNARVRHARALAAFGASGVKAQGRGGVRFWMQVALLLTGAALAIVALARPQWGEEPIPSMSPGRNVVILLDVSRSMLARDVRPSRLERARADLSELVTDLHGDAAALVAFRGSATVLCPFTTDTAFLLSQLASVSPDSARPGETDLGAALESALALFGESTVDHNAIILVSDGEDLSGRAADVAARCAERRIPVFTVGVGTAAGAAVPTSGDASDADVVEWKGERVSSKLDEASLSRIASVSGGVYLPVASTSRGMSTLGSIYRRYVRALVEEEFQEAKSVRRIDRYAVFLLPAVLCWLLAAALSAGRPLRRRASMAALLLAAFVLASCASTPRATQHDFAFAPDGTFTFLQWADAQEDGPLPASTRAFLDRVLAEEKPALVVLTGDNIGARRNRRETFEPIASSLVAPLVAARVPFCVTFGNHDADIAPADGGLSLDEQYAFYRAAGGACFVDHDVRRLSGAGNGCVEIRDGDTRRVAARIYVMDSGSLTSRRGWESCRGDQIDFFERTRGDVPAVWLQHIPVPEIARTGLVRGVPADVPIPYTPPPWDGRRFVLGENATGVLGQPPMFSDERDYEDAAHRGASGRTLYEAWRAAPRFVGAFFGHDHLNSWQGRDRNGIFMGATSALRRGTDKNANPAVRLFKLHRDGTLETKMIFESGEQRAEGGDLNTEARSNRRCFAYAEAKRTLPSPPLCGTAKSSLQSGEGDMVCLPSAATPRGEGKQACRKSAYAAGICGKMSSSSSSSFRSAEADRSDNSYLASSSV